jgi:hypothetical protein
VTGPYIVPPSAIAVGVWDSGNGGELIATLPAAVYPRKITGVSVTASVACAVEFFQGFISAANRFDNSPVGNNNTADYPNPRINQSNTPVLVRWTSPLGIPSTNTAQANFFLESM